MYVTSTKAKDHVAMPTFRPVVAELSDSVARWRKGDEK
jgi:hypothetical protein